LAVLAKKRDPEGHDRKRERDQGKPLAGKSTLNRLELTKANAGQQERYCKIGMDACAVTSSSVGERSSAQHSCGPLASQRCHSRWSRFEYWLEKVAA
jgi:hypothetical protein